jgi:hypothetical protein
MENMYYFSQGRLIHNAPSTIFVDPKIINKTKDTKEEKDVNIKSNDIGYKIFNFQIFNPSILRYK